MKRILGCLMLLAAAAAQAQYDTNYGYQAAQYEQYSTASISAFGYQSLFNATYAYGSSAFGAGALRNATGNYNTAMGLDSMYYSTTGCCNTVLGTEAGYQLGSGGYNIAIGYAAGYNETVNGSYNIWLGHPGLAKDNAVIRIGQQGVQKFTQIAGIYNVVVTGGLPVVVNAKGQLGVAKAAATAPLAMQSDVDTLRHQVAALANQVYALQRQLAAKH